MERFPRRCIHRTGSLEFRSPDPDNGYAGTQGYVNALASASALKLSARTGRRDGRDPPAEFRDCYFFYFV